MGMAIGFPFCTNVSYLSTSRTQLTMSLFDIIMNAPVAQSDSVTTAEVPDS